MNAPSVRGACPSLFAPMASGDGLLVRVKPPGSVLTAAAARALAAAAARWGNGTIELTRRASLQVRGLAADSVAPFAAAMVAAGLGERDAAVEARRNIVVSPLAGADAGVHPATSAVAADLAHRLARDAAVAALPDKFGFTVDGGGALGLDGVAVDVAIRFAEGRWLVIPDGSTRAVACAADTAAKVAIGMAHTFLNVTAAMAEAPRRMRALLQARGEAAVLGAGPTVQVVPTSVGERVLAGRDVGGAFAVGLPFGTIAAAALGALAGLAGRHGDGVLRLTPFRAVLIASVRDRAGLLGALAQLDLITDPHDGRSAVAACPGGPACASGTVATRGLASVLAGLGTGVHVSGCSKGCAHPGRAPVTLVGREGRFDLVRDGRASDAPVARGLSAAEAIALLERVPA